MVDPNPLGTEPGSWPLEQALREPNVLFGLLTEHAKEAIRVHTLGGTTVYSSPSVDTLYGRVPPTMFAFAHPDELERCRQWWNCIVAGENSLLQFRILHATGDIRWLESSAAVITYHDTRYVLTFCRDVTERIRSEQLLHDNDQLFRQVLDAVPEGVVVTDRSGNVLLSNPAMQLIWGVMIGSGDERYHRSKGWWLDTGAPLEPNEWPSVVATTTGKTSLNNLIEIEAFDGVRRTIRCSAAPILSPDGTVTGSVIINENVTDMLKLELQLRQSQKMEALGHLAAGVAHDFNNLLTIITGYSDILLAGLSSEDPGREMVSEIGHAGERAAGLTRQLLAFCRQSVLEPKVLDLNDVVRESERLLRRLIGEDVQFTSALEQSLDCVKVDHGQISQVIINLVVNARDAMPKGGNLRIETHNTTIEASSFTSDPDAQPGRYVLLIVADNGTGMTADVKAHIFEPFFTTKGPGKGTGLGLATVYGIVKQSGGFVSVESEPGSGTAFMIYLPVVAPAIAPTAPTASLPSTHSVAGGTETILVAEDDEAVRALIRRILQRAGYTVLDASRGASALRIAEEYNGHLHMLITDVVMPEMGGRELVESMPPVREGIKVLYLSGHTDDDVLRHGVFHAEVAFLHKPFTIAALTAKVRQVLDG